MPRSIVVKSRAAATAARKDAKKSSKESAEALRAAKKAQKTADKCASDLKKRTTQVTKLQSAYIRCERAIAIGNIGRGLRTATLGSRAMIAKKRKLERMREGKEKAKLRRQISEQEKASDVATKKAAKEGFRLGKLEAPAARPAPKKRKGKKPTKRKKPTKAKAPTPIKKPTKGRVKPVRGIPLPKAARGDRDRKRKPKATAKEVQILAGVGGKGPTKAYRFWTCAGPVRSGCGHSSSFVVGDLKERRAIRIRGTQPLRT